MSFCDEGHIPIPICLALRNLIVVVRKRQINPTRVNIYHFPQNLRAHDRALDMPARPALPPRTLPARLALLARLPEGKILRTLLLFWERLPTDRRRRQRGRFV